MKMAKIRNNKNVKSSLTCIITHGLMQKYYVRKKRSANLKISRQCTNVWHFFMRSEENQCTKSFHAF